MNQSEVRLKIILAFVGTFIGIILALRLSILWLRL